MAMMCDLLVAAENARFSYPEGKVGITGGMIAGLAARIPHKIAMEIMLLGEPIDAERAYPGGAGEPGRRRTARRSDEAVALAPQDGRSGAARAGNDEALRQRARSAARPGRTGRARFGAELAAVRNSADAAEGVRAFKEKRKPRYQGH